MSETPQYKLRPVEASEIWDVLEWRNAERVRRAMLTQHKISKSEHREWWDRKMLDHSVRIMILENGSDRLSVQSFFDIKPDGTAWWAFYFTPAVPDDLAQMMKIWKFVELAGISYAFGGLGLDRVRCEVLKSNAGVLNWHKRFGFQVCSQALSNNSGDYDLEVLEMDRDAYSKSCSPRSVGDVKNITFQPHEFDKTLMMAIKQA